MNLPSSWQVPDQIKERFGLESSGKQRAMEKDGHLLLVLHKAPRRGQQKREPVFFWRDPQGTWSYSGWGEGLAQLKKHLQEYNTAEDEFSEMYDQANEALDYFSILEELGPLLHAAKNMHATLQAAREAIPQEREIIDLRDWAYGIERTLELLYMDTKNALDFSIAKQAEEQAHIGMQAVQTAHRLNILAAIFFPLTAITSIFGMNLNSGLENAGPWPFWIIFLIGISLGFIIRGWVLGSSQQTKRQ